MDREIRLTICFPQKQKQISTVQSSDYTVEELIMELENFLGCSDEQTIKLYQGERELKNKYILGDLTQHNLEGKIITKQEEKPINIRIFLQERNKAFYLQVNPNDKIQTLIDRLQYML